MMSIYFLIAAMMCISIAFILIVITLYFDQERVINNLGATAILFCVFAVICLTICAAIRSRCLLSCRLRIC